MALILYYYPARSPGRRSASEEIRVTLKRAGASLSGEIRTRQHRGAIQATLTGEDLSGEFSLEGVRCNVSGTTSGDGATVTGAFDCASDGAGSLVLNRL